MPSDSRMSADYKLSCSLVGHTMDVRCVAVGSDFVVTGSRDRTAKLWRPDRLSGLYVDAQTLCGHTNFVSCVCVVPPDDQHPSGMVLTGSNDKTICAFVPDGTSPIYRLTGHGDTVCALAVGRFGTVVSGSWDKTARVWLNQKCMMTLTGHEATVWAVAVVTQHGLVLTASADKTVKSWKAGQCDKTFTGHTDCVRALVVAANDDWFLSAANDGTVRKWNVATGEPLSCFQAHDSFIYSLALLPDGRGYISTGEDRSLRIWDDDGACRQVIVLPAQSVWASGVQANGDIVTGSSDAVARIFSCASERQAGPEEIAAFEEEATGSDTNASGLLGNIKISDLPGKEALYEPGKRDGQTKLVRDGGKVVVYQWVAEESRWAKIGDAMGAAGSQAPGTKVHFEGKEYDFVFDVDIEDGKPPLKLPFNTTEDPWFAAQKFIEQNNLSQMFLDQVANFIIKNTKGVTLGMEQVAVSDPFTGQARYTPGSGTKAAPSTGTDPFTGSGRYVPTSSSNATQQQPRFVPVNQYFPQKKLLTFESGNVQAIEGKLKEFAALGRIAVNDVEIHAVVRLAEVGSECKPDVLVTLERLLRSPRDVVFPSLDVLRLAVRNPLVFEHFFGNGGHFLRFVLDHLSSSSPPSNQMLTLRLLCNIMGYVEGKRLVMANLGDILNAALQSLPIANKNNQIAFATLLLNLAVLLENGDLEIKAQCLSGVSDVLNTFDDAEAQFRLVVAIGTFAASDKDSLMLVRSMDLVPFVQRMRSVGDPVKVSQCAEHVEALLSQC